MTQILKAENVTMRFAGLTAVDKVSFTQNDNEILSLIGPNGAGKTTFFNMLTGVYKPTEGKLFYKGEDITGLKPYELVKKGISRTFQNIRLFKTMTTLENLLVAAPECHGESLKDAILCTSGLKRKRGIVVERCEQILEVLKLQDSEEEYASNLPYGKQRLLEIGRALATGADFLLLDEPGAGMNSSEKEELANVVHFLTDQMHKNVLLIEHDMNFVMNISDRIVVLDHGIKIAEGVPSEIQNNQAVIEAYLGKGIPDDDDD